MRGQGPQDGKQRRHKTSVCDRCGSQIQHTTITTHQASVKCRNAVFWKRMAEKGWAPTTDVRTYGIPGELGPHSHRPYAQTAWHPTWVSAIIQVLYDAARHGTRTFINRDAVWRRCRDDAEYRDALVALSMLDSDPETMFGLLTQAAAEELRSAAVRAIRNPLDRRPPPPRRSGP